MSLSISDSGSSYELAPAGVHIVRCCGLIDLGTQSSNWQGKETRQPKIQLRFELLGDDRMTDGSPYLIQRRLTASLGERATLRALLKSWRGRDFTPAELKKFDLKNVAGQYALANIVHDTREGSTYANLASLSPLPKGMPKPDGVNELLIFDLSHPDNNAWERLSPRMQEVILSSPEGHAWMNGSSQTTATRADASNPAQSLYGRRPELVTKPDDPDAGADFDDDIPFD